MKDSSKMNRIVFRVTFVLILLRLFMGFVYFLSGEGKEEKSAEQTAAVETEAAAEGITAIEYSFSGDMNGSYSGVELHRISDDEVEIVIEKQSSHNQPRKTTKKTVSADIIKEAEKIIDENEMLTWKDLPKSDMIASDAGTGTFRIVKDKMNYITYSFQQWPDGGEAIYEIVEMIEKAAE